MMAPKPKKDKNKAQEIDISIRLDFNPNGQFAGWSIGTDHTDTIDERDGVQVMAWVSRALNSFMEESAGITNEAVIPSTHQADDLENYIPIEFGKIYDWDELLDQISQAHWLNDFKYEDIDEIEQVRYELAKYDTPLDIHEIIRHSPRSLAQSIEDKSSPLTYEQVIAILIVLNYPEDFVLIRKKY